MSRFLFILSIALIHYQTFSFLHYISSQVFSISKDQIPKINLQRIWNMIQLVLIFFFCCFIWKMVLLECEFIFCACAQIDWRCPKPGVVNATNFLVYFLRTFFFLNKHKYICFFFFQTQNKSKMVKSTEKCEKAIRIIVFI